MVVSKQVEVPFYRYIGRQRGRGLVAIPQVFERTAIPFQRKDIVPAAERVGADFWGFAALESADVISGRKKFQDSCKECGKTISEKTIG